MTTTHETPDWLLQLINQVCDTIEDSIAGISWRTYEEDGCWDAELWPALTPAANGEPAFGPITVVVEDALFIFDDKVTDPGATESRPTSVRASSDRVSFDGAFSGHPVLLSILFEPPEDADVPDVAAESILPVEN